MTKRKSEGPLPPPNLTVAKEEALQKIKIIIEEGNSILGREIRSREDFEQVESLESKWSSFGHELLSRYFDNQQYAEEFDYAGLTGRIISRGGPPTLNEKLERIKKRMRSRIQTLESICERLELIPAPEGLIQHVQVPEKAMKKGRTIFIVHGHDEAGKEAVARFLGKLDLTPIILHEKPDRGRTIIEKFEDYSDVAFAVILLTCDDLGSSLKFKDNPEKVKPRARQNVIFELGYFIGKLGRKNVCALYQEEVELPSDIQGVLYVPMDPGEGWHMKLAREIKHSGIDIDLNKVL